MKSSAWSIWMAVLIMPIVAFAQIPPGYPRDYAATIAAAQSEGKVVIYGATDMSVASHLIRDFRALYPKVQVEYHDVDSLALYNRFLKEIGAGVASADVLWSSAMDLQVKLVNDGYAMPYPSPEIPHLPDWAMWKIEAYGTTFEPVGIAYNKRNLIADEIPQTHHDFVQLLNAKPDRFKGKVITYDLEKSGLGFLFAAQDARTSSVFWDIARALGKCEARLDSNTATMLDSIASGKTLLAYNLLGAYAYARSRSDPTVGFVYPRDYTLVISRIAFINKRAGNPNAARLWLDYLLSKRGQTVLANQSGMFALRSDVSGETTAAALTRTLGSSLKPVAIGPSLMAYLDRRKRRDFLSQWKQAVESNR